MRKGKRIEIGAKPTEEARAATADAWVTKRGEPIREPTKRFTIDVPVSLHRRVKSQCALQNLVMAEVMRELLEERFPATHERPPEGEKNRAYDLS